MKTVRTLLPCAALLAFATAANAADAITMPPPEAPAPLAVSAPSDWNGGYAGATVGYAFSSDSKLTDGTDSWERDGKGFLGGVFAGYNWQSGSFVYGVEGDLSVGKRNENIDGGKEKWGIDTATLRPRLGYAITDKILLYGTAGGAVKPMSYYDGTGKSDSKTMLGWTAGAGADVKLTERTFAKLEYRYTDFGKEKFNIDGTSYTDETKQQKVLIGIGISF
ncbi:outer membrane protein [Chelativorans salis]|uniref:Porin family protein n=1 Tax=Chelativorans salis TaxID=2978478 RepID=A0ABT2LQK4_9HYPH|nr:outer membrane protein [Chelativorans sp. EGI FJ00035]MCT7375913.1 porin family protein [Chelativorans sp. EGI FJ00035]